MSEGEFERRDMAQMVPLEDWSRMIRKLTELESGNELSDQRLRVEALRAAAQISGSTIYEAHKQYGFYPGEAQVGGYILKVARILCDWLNTGENWPKIVRRHEKEWDGP